LKDIKKLLGYLEINSTKTKKGFPLTINILTQRNVFYLNILLGIVLIISTFFVVRDVISHYFEQKKNVQKGAYSAKVTTAEPEVQISEYALILANNPFGFSGGEIKTLTGSTSHKTQQGDIMLIGTVVGPKELSYGIFRDSAGIQEVFKIGDPVFDIGKLHRVEQAKVIIRKGEKTVEILLEDVKVKEVKKQASAASPSPSSFAQKIGRSTYMVDQARLQQAIANPGQMMTDARLKPNIVNGKEEGFVLSEVKQGGVYHSLGLQDGDVLLRINEYDISNPERALQAFTALKGMERVQVDLIRSGSRMTMTYQIK
jgi:general secretion pathway protein C